jgi:hypothetical protein
MVSGSVNRLRNTLVGPISVLHSWKTKPKYNLNSRLCFRNSPFSIIKKIWWLVIIVSIFLNNN